MQHGYHATVCMPGCKHDNGLKQQSNLYKSAIFERGQKCHAQLLIGNKFGSLE